MFLPSQWSLQPPAHPHDHHRHPDISGQSFLCLMGGSPSAFPSRNKRPWQSLQARQRSRASILFDKGKSCPVATWHWHLVVLSLRKFQVPLLSERANCLRGKVVLVYRGSVFFLSLLKKPVIHWAVKWKIKIRGSGNNIMYLGRNIRTLP